MSVPFSTLYCPSCDAEWSSLMLHGYFEYELSEGRYLSVERCMGWCKNCNNVEAVEKLPNINDVMADLHKAEEKLSSAKSQIPTKLLSLLMWKFNKKRRVATEKMIKNAHIELNKCHIRQNFRQSRTELEKCLKCGNFDIITFNNLPTFSSEEYRSITPKNKLTNYTHPICGDRMYIRTSGGVRVSGEYPRKLYDRNGNRKRGTFQCDYS